MQTRISRLTGPLLDVLNQTLAAQYLLPMRDGAQLAQRLATHPARVFAYDGMERSISRNTDHAKQEEGYSTKNADTLNNNYLLKKCSVSTTFYPLSPGGSTTKKWSMSIPMSANQ